ncbi:shootin-1-like isoform X2 [Sipha flava]|nr:shootin-1-like isoform X2 [Sipha flava]
MHATLMNNLQIRKISINNNELNYVSDIIWYVDKSTLKKFKMSNASIRIECFHVPINKSSSREKLGYLILKLKGAQTLSATSNDRVEIKSYKLIGSKNCSYNLTMSLCIEDVNVKNIDSIPKKNNKNLNYIDSNLQKEENKQSEEDIQINISKSDVYIAEQIENILGSIEPQNLLNFDGQEKLIDELEDWKDKQMILFNEKLKIKEEQMLKELNKKWLDDRKRIEEELNLEISKCRALTENMDKITDMLVERESIITAKELELTCEKDSMENKYISLVTNLQYTNVKIINELKSKNVELESRLSDFEKNNILLKKENEQLKNNINSSSDLQIEQLEKIISHLESKYEKANESCMFFKERWITSVRKINQMYTKLHGIATNEHLLNSRQNIQNILTNMLGEQNYD